MQIQTKFKLKPPAFETETAEENKSIEELFLESMKKAGITNLPSENIIPDGEIHRFYGSGKDKGRRNGWYVLSEEKKCGVFGDWAEDIKQYFNMPYSRTLSESEIAQIEANRADIEKKEREYRKQRQEQVAFECQEEWNRLPEPDRHHPYLVKKGLKNGYGCRQSDTSLVIPLFDENNRISSLQYISPNGDKQFKSEAKVKGCCFQIGSGTPVFLAEGFATAAAIYQETRKPCLAAFNADNLVNIAKRFPNVTIIADNDKNHKGENSALKCQETYGTQFRLIPIINDGDTDADDFMLSGGDLCSFLGIDRPEFRFISLKDAVHQPVPPRWLVENLIPQGAKLSMLFGDSGNGKTYFAIDWMLSVATSQVSWFGKRVSPAKVLYLCGEGHDSAYQRMTCWLQQKGITEIPDTMYISREAMDLDTYTGQNELIDILSEELLGFEPEFAVVDTMNLFMQGDENDTQQATAFIKALKSLSLDYNCSIMLVQHTGVAENSKDRSRGSSVFKGAIETQIKIERDQTTGIFTLTQTKSKSSVITDPMHFALDIHEVAGWVNAYGETVTDGVIVQTESKASVHIPPQQKKDLDLIYYACISTKRILEARSPFVTVTLEELRSYLKLKWPEDTKKASRELNRKQDGKLMTRLLKDKVLTEIQTDTFAITDEDFRAKIFKRAEHKFVHCDYSTEGLEND